MNKVDAAVIWIDQKTAYFFYDDLYVRYDMVSDLAYEGYPRSINPNWSGLPPSFHQKIDAALIKPDKTKVFFFSGSEYVRYDISNDSADIGYPFSIYRNWPGLTFTSGIDAAVLWNDDRTAYFFKGNEYTRYDMVADQAAAGYPRLIRDGWNGLPASFQAGVDAALLSVDKKKVYFFKKNEYVRYDILTDKMDPGYPLPIADNWPPNRIIRFQSDDIEVQVPAQGLFGSPPNRSITFEMQCSKDYVHAEQFYEHVYYHSNGLEDSQKIDQTYNDGPGLRYKWELENNTSFPVNGRTAEMKVNLIVRRKMSYKTTPPGFSKTYISLRKQFFDLFFHNGLVADSYICKKNDNDTDCNIDQIYFGDQAMNMGLTLLMLVGEFEIWNKLDNKDEIKNVSNVIEIIFNALDNKIEVSGDGFIRRDSITGVNDPTLNRKFKVVKSDFQNGRDNEASIDQYVHLMVGLLTVCHAMRHSSNRNIEIANRASGFIERYFKYLAKHKFRVKFPDDRLVKRGDDARGFVTLLHGIYLKATRDDMFDSLEIDYDNITSHQGVKIVGSIWDNGSLLSLILNQFGDAFNSFTSHMALQLLCSSDVWTQQQLEQAVDPKHLLSIMLYSYFHNTSPMTVSWDYVQNIMSLCPSSGPSNRENIWNKDNIWERGGSGSPSIDPEEKYTGLDYMIVHNFAQLVYEKTIV